MFPVPWVHLLVVKPQDQRQSVMRLYYAVFSSYWRRSFHHDVKTSCSLIIEILQGLLPNMGSLMFLFFVFFTAWIYHFCFHKTMKPAHSCLAKCHDSSSNNCHVFWWLLEKWCMLLDHNGVLTEGKMVWLSKDSTQKGWRPEYSSGVDIKALKCNWEQYLTHQERHKMNF